MALVLIAPDQHRLVKVGQDQFEAGPIPPPRRDHGPLETFIDDDDIPDPTPNPDHITDDPERTLPEERPGSQGDS